MPLDPRVKRFLDVLAAGNPPDARSVSVAQRRAQLTELMKFAGPALPGAKTRDFTLPGTSGVIAARAYGPIAASTEAMLPGLIYFHGGGMVAGSIDTHASIAQALAHHGACRVISVDYRLAPEHPFPAALEDAETAVDYIVRNAHEFGLDAQRLGVCGDSAGATLVAVTCQKRARSGAERLALQLLLCPILDYSRDSGSRRDFAAGYLVDQATLEHDLAHYVPGGANPLDPRISPLRAESLSGIPPTVIHTAEFDPLRDEGEEYFKRLGPIGSAVSYTCHAGMIHLFYGLGGVIPYARSALERIGDDIKRVLGAQQ